MQHKRRLQFRKHICPNPIKAIVAKKQKGWLTRSRGYQGEKDTGWEKSDFMPEMVTLRRER
jgi:hypothetical protein